MGQNMDPTEIEYGQDCALKFAPGQAPKYLYARFIEIETCPLAPATAPNDRTFTLTQHAAFPCLWEHTGPTWFVSFEFILVLNETCLWLKHIATGREYFLKSENGYTDEGFVFVNGYDNCAGVVCGINGLGVVTWRLEPLKVMSQLNITSSKLFMEMRPIDDGSRVYKFCKLQDATNIKIKYHPEA